MGWNSLDGLAEGQSRAELGALKLFWKPLCLRAGPLSNYTFSLDFRNSSAHVVCVAGKVSRRRNRLLFVLRRGLLMDETGLGWMIDRRDSWRYGQLTQG